MSSANPCRAARPVIVLCLAVWLAACGRGDAQPVVEAPWIREAPPEAQVLAGYMSIRNEGRRPVLLTAISAPGFDRVEMHETRMDGDRMRMQAVANVDLPPDRTVEFRPGGLHLMLMGPERRFTDGDSVTLTLEFSDGQRLPVDFEVRDARTVE